MEETPLTQEGTMGVIEQPEQPQSRPQPTFQPTPQLDEATVRAAVMQAEQAGEDPTRITVAQVGTSQPQATEDVPDKFKKPNGEVDVEKLNASTRQLDEALQQKAQKLQEVQKVVPKSVDDYLREYKAKEKLLRSTPNPERIAAQAPQPVQPQIPQNAAQMTDQQLEAMIAADLQANPARTVAQLVQLAMQKELQERLKPIEEERQDNQIRGNIKQLADKDPRVLHPEVFAAINAKLESDPDLWKLKNPHRAAWLEVREELRLGEPSQVQAQPSKPTAPILGGGTPPPAPSSSSGQVDINTLLQATKQIASDPRSAPKRYDQKDWNKLDQVARQLFDRR